MVEGIVLEAGRGVYTVQVPGGAIVACKLRGNLKKTLTYADSLHRARKVERVRKLRDTDPIAVGDRVDFSLGESIGEGVIERVHPRRAILARQSGNERERQTLVANLELAVIVFAAAEPRIDPYKLDRFLVLAEDAELDILIVVNKSDLESEGALEAMGEEYRRIGYPVIATSVRTGAGIAALRAALHGRVSALCGPSGVGKSSLLNAVEPGLSLRTGETGDTTHAGRHTTVRARLLSLVAGRVGGGYARPATSDVLGYTGRGRRIFVPGNGAAVGWMPFRRLPAPARTRLRHPGSRGVRCDFRTPV